MKFRKKPVVIEAVQFTGANHAEIFEFCPIARNCAADKNQVSNRIWIPTLEGGHIADPNDWIIKGIAGEFYPCKPEIFGATYEPVIAENLGGIIKAQVESYNELQEALKAGHVVQRAILNQHHQILAWKSVGHVSRLIPLVRYRIVRAQTAGNENT